MASPLRLQTDTWTEALGYGLPARDFPVLNVRDCLDGSWSKALLRKLFFGAVCFCLLALVQLSSIIVGVLGIGWIRFQTGSPSRPNRRKHFERLLAGTPLESEKGRVEPRIGSVSSMGCSPNLVS